MRGVKLRLSLGQKLYAVAGLLAVMSVALSLNAFLPLRRATGQVAVAKGDVARALSTDAAARRTAEWLWQLGALVLTGPDGERDSVGAAFVGSVQSVQSWIASEPSNADARQARAVMGALNELDRVAQQLIQAVGRDDAPEATRLFVDGLSLPATKQLSLPLDQATRREEHQMREAFVRLSGDAAAAGPLASSRLTDHVVRAASRVDRALSLSGYMQIRLLHASLLTLSLLGTDVFDPAALPLLAGFASSELGPWEQLTRKAAADDPRLMSTVPLIVETNTKLDETGQRIATLMGSGDLEGARGLLASEFESAMNAQLSSVKRLIAADEAFADETISFVIRDARLIAAIIATFALIVLALALVSAVAAQRAARRIALTIRAVRELGSGDYAAHVPVDGADELTQLSLAFNELGRDLAAAHEKEARFLQKTVEAAEAERMQLAAELHDGPIQRLTGVLYGLERTGGRLERGDISGVGELVSAARTSVSNEVGALRRFLTELRPPVLDERGLDAALHDYVSDFSRRSGVECDFDARLGERLPEALETTMYRVVQEALSNVRKHANASHASVALWRHNGNVRLLVSDDGVGFERDSGRATSTEHFGLTSMYERVRMAGGNFQIESKPGGGTTILAVVPHRNEESA